MSVSVQEVYSSARPASAVRRMAFSLLLSTAVTSMSGTTLLAAAEERYSLQEIEEVVVTVRKREETLKDVPISATAITGNMIERRGFTSVKDVAVMVPGLNINSDSVGRSFIAIRGIGVTLQSTVQPGVGLFIDGIYQPNTSYLNNPLLDVDRVEVLRGPQGTLYGKNTLGGAINVITRQPGNEFSGRITGSYAGPDNSWLLSGSASGAIVPDKLQLRMAVAHREQEGFINNTLVGGDANALDTDSINATIRFLPTDDVTLSVKGYYDSVQGARAPYVSVAGPTDYSRDAVLNALNTHQIDYKGINAKLSFPISNLNTDVTVVGSYDRRDNSAVDSDGDFGLIDIVRTAQEDTLETKTFELRFDSEINDQFSSLLGFFYSRETTDLTKATTIVPASITNTSVSATEADTLAVFGTLFWQPAEDLEITAGMRYDYENRGATGGALINGAIVPIPPANIKSNQVEPRLSITKHWDEQVMTYASVARGYRGGGFNSPLAPQRTYGGDFAWTYELGTKYTSEDRSLSLSGAVFYNDYKNYIGQNSLAPSPAGGFVTVDLNTGDVESYGAEIEFSYSPTSFWTINGSGALIHARITDSSQFTATTERLLPTDRLIFQPDWNFNLSTDYVVPVGEGDLVFFAGITGKGDRKGAGLSETFSPTLEKYFIVNSSIAYHIGNVEISVFVNNLFDADYFESYIDESLLAAVGLPSSSLGIVGDRRRVGVRTRLTF